MQYHLNLPKMLTRETTWLPKHHKWDPKGSLVASRRPKRAATSSQVGPRGTQEHLKRAQEAPKGRPKSSKIALGGHLGTPRKTKTQNAINPWGNHSSRTKNAINTWESCMSGNDFLGSIYEKPPKPCGFSLLWGRQRGKRLENLDSKWTGKHSEHGWQSSKLASRQQNSKLASCCTSEENRIDL